MVGRRIQRDETAPNLAAEIVCQAARLPRFARGPARQGGGSPASLLGGRVLLVTPEAGVLARQVLLPRARALRGSQRVCAPIPHPRAWLRTSLSRLSTVWPSACASSSAFPAQSPPPRAPTAWPRR